MASESAGLEEGRDAGHRNHFRMLQEEGLSWSGREPNTLFQNRGDGTFDEVGNVLGVYLRLDSRGAAVADLDGDGDLDLVVYNRNNPIVKVFRNDTPGQGHAALFDLRATVGERLATGAQVVVTCDERRMLRQVELGSGFLSQGPPTLHFGLGGCAEIDLVTVTWPSGEEQVWQSLPVDHRFVLQQRSPEVELWPLERRNHNRDERPVAAGELSAERPELSFEPIDGGEAWSLAAFDDATVVLNFWATWCTACESELGDLQALHQRFAERGVRFVGVSLDEDRPLAAVEAFLEERGVTYDQVWGSVEEERPFASLGGSPPGAIPVTAVVHRGTVRDVEVGKIELEEMATLLERLLDE